MFQRSSENASDKCIRGLSFDDLPVEVVSSIFTFLIAPTGTAPKIFDSINRVKPISTICSVSPRWYDIAVQTPHLWSVITITAEAYFPADTIQLWLDRSKGAFLDISIVSMSQRAGSISLKAFLSLAQRSSQWRYLKLILNSVDWEYIRPLLPSELPRLINVRSWIAWVSPPENSNEVDIPSPLLTTLSASGYIPFNPCHALTNFEVRDLNSSGWARFAHVVSNAPLLSKLRIHARFLASNAIVEILELPSLEELLLDVNTVTVASSILSSLNAPRLATLHLGSPADVKTSESEKLGQASFHHVHRITFSHALISTITRLLATLSFRGRPELTLELDVSAPGNKSLEATAERRGLEKQFDVRVIWTAVRTGMDK